MEKLKILVIDDDEDLIKLYGRALSAQFEVITECNGTRAITKAIELKPDVVLLDLHMPNVDGFEVLAQFKNQSSHFSFPIICSSGDISGESRDHAYKLGAIGFISKPSNIKLLAADIFGFLKNINTINVSRDKRKTYIMTYNEFEKQKQIAEVIMQKNELNKASILLTWSDPTLSIDSQLSHYIKNESLIYLKIKPTLITKFNYIQDLNIIINDITDFLPNSEEKTLSSFQLNLIFDEPNFLFQLHENNNSKAKIFSFMDIFQKNFSSLYFFSKKTHHTETDLQLANFASLIVGF